jgi:DNA helicase II / ATP-dependent DNA helicase PcrA
VQSLSKLNNELNDEQKKAVQHTKGPLLILAGAGAGKTKTLTHRILNLIEIGIPAYSILAITFTNKAAKEMRDRVINLITSQISYTKSKIPIAVMPFVSTFHSLGVHIIKENASLLGLTKYFTIYDRGDSKRAIKDAIIEAGFDPKQFDPGLILGIISKQKGDGMDLQRFEKSIASESNKNFISKVTAATWKKYEEKLKKEKALDFDDLLLKTLNLLEKYPDVLERYQSLWTYIHIDEYQDTNTVQYKIAKILAQKHQNICVVGDIDQNIYSWRGADIKNILNFEKDYPNATIVILEENYRSTNIILTAANKIIEKNKNRREKNLYTRQAGGEKILLYGAFDETDEAEFIARTSGELIEEGVRAEEVAVLYRANFQSRAIEEAFLMYNIPYQVLGTKFFERKEIKDIVSFIKASLNPDCFSDFKRILNIPPRGIGKTTLMKIEMGQEESLPTITKQKIIDFRKLLEDLKEILLTHPTSVAIKELVKKTGINQMYKKGKEEDEERIENIKELIALSTRYDHMSPEEGILKFLEDASLASDQDELDKTSKDKQGKVKLMTVHASKGLEFDYVFVGGLEAELFPHKRISETRITNDEAEEERRLFYVAITRARKKLYLTYSAMRTIFGMRKPNIVSEFVTDIPGELIEQKDNNFGIKAVFIDY